MQEQAVQAVYRGSNSSELSTKLYEYTDTQFAFRETALI